MSNITSRSEPHAPSAARPSPLAALFKQAWVAQHKAVYNRVKERRDVFRSVQLAQVAGGGLCAAAFRVDPHGRVEGDEGVGAVLRHPDARERHGHLIRGALVEFGNVLHTMHDSEDAWGGAGVGEGGWE